MVRYCPTQRSLINTVLLISIPAFEHSTALPNPLFAQVQGARALKREDQEQLLTRSVAYFDVEVTRKLIVIW